MNKNSVKFLYSVFWVMMGTASGIAGSITNPAEAVDVAGKQRMFTMRLLRDYIMIGEKLSYKDPVMDLKKTINSFENSQKELIAYVSNPSLKTELQAIDKKWQEIKKTLSQPPQKELAATYAKTAIDFREMLNTFVDHLAESSGGNAAQAVNLSGRLRAVSQALASVYQLRAWGMPGAEKRMEIPMKRFRGSLDYLATAEETADPMKKYLAKLENIYHFFEIMNEAETFTPTLVIKKTDTMLKLATELTTLYVQSVH